MRGAYRIAPVVALSLLLFAGGALGCDWNPFASSSDPKANLAPKPQRQRPQARVDDPNVALPPLSREAVEGAPTAELVFARAQQAAEDHAYITLLLCVRPSTRGRWLQDLVVSVAVASSDDGTESDPAVIRMKARVRSTLREYGAYGSIQNTDDLTANGVGRALLDKVKDPDGLYVALLNIAADARVEYDLVTALEHPHDKRRAPDPTAAGLLRLVSRVRAPNKLGDVKFDGPLGQALTDTPDAGPTDGAFMPLRFFQEGPTVWLDES